MRKRCKKDIQEYEKHTKNLRNKYETTHLYYLLCVLDQDQYPRSSIANWTQGPPLPETQHLSNGASLPTFGARFPKE